MGVVVIESVVELIGCDVGGTMGGGGPWVNDMSPGGGGMLYGRPIIPGGPGKIIPGGAEGHDDGFGACGGGGIIPGGGGKGGCGFIFSMDKTIFCNLQFM